ncbi:hypothetical protein LX13_000568 [Williamsia maris]|uniref:Type VII secretion system (Wss) protein ESAT-6 n=2 Tax=Williamsia maris TaxID=72806 RepID=A0ABT1HAP0_9NOCA|nr:hypothetical protein [Williamsia maris]
MGRTLQGAPGLIEPIVTDLTTDVDKLGNDASWSGDAAGTFRKLWSSDALRAGGIGVVAGQAGDTIAGLGDQLAALDAALYNAAHEAASRGAQIGADGRPLPLVITGDATTPAAVAAMQAQGDYQAAFDETMQLAQGFRLDAASDLAALMEPIADDESGESGEGLDLEKATTIGDYLKAFYVVPNDRNASVSKKLPDQIKNSRNEFRDLRKQLKTEKAAYADKGLSIPKDNLARLDHLSASRELKEMSGKLADAQVGKGEFPMSQILNTKIGDIEKAVPGATKALPKSLNFLKEIPVIDVAASGLVAEIQAVEDHQKGWSETTAHANDYAAAAGGLAAGAATVAGVAALPFEVPAAGVALVGGAVVVGIGGLGYNAFHEHWSEDVHDHGVVAGILHGTGNTFANTGSDIGDMGVSVGHAAKSVWKSVFG